MKATLKYYLSVFLRRLPWFLIPAVAISAAGIIIAFSLPPSYVSQTRFVVEPSQIPSALAPPTSSVSPTAQLQLIQQRVLARANLLDTARRLNVFPNMGALSADQIVSQMRQATDIRLIGSGSSIPQMTISFESPSSATAAAVVNDYLTFIQQADVESRAGRASQTLQFFQQEVDRLSGELSVQNQRLLDFQNANLDALPDGQGFRISQQSQLQQRFDQLDRDITSLTEQRARIIQVFENTGQIEALGGTSRSPEQVQLDNLRAQLNQAMAVYAPTNPRIQVLRSRIAQLEQQISVSQGGVGTGSPLDMQLAEIDARVEELRAQQSRINTDLARVTDAIGRTPANSVAMAAIQRDRENIQSQYDRAVTSLASASASERVEVLSQGRRIAVIEQPSVPSAPTKPNRTQIALMSVMAGIGAGLALVVLLELINRSPRRPEDLIKKLGIMPLATIPYMRSNREIVWQRGLKAALILLILIGIPVLVWGVHTYYQPLDLLAQRVMNRIGL